MTRHTKENQWMYFRHKVVTKIAYAILYPYTVWKYKIKVDRLEDSKNRPYLILFNHQTAFDQFFVGMAFYRPVYYLASEDLFSNGFVSTLIRYLVAPIPIKKQTTDIGAIKNCIRVAREGGTLAIAPEGNRTYSGKTEYMPDTIAPLAKKLKLPIALYRIEGGYGVQPRWSDVVRKGKMRGYVAKVIEPEEYSNMTNEELFNIIEEGLMINEAVADGNFKHKKRAEYLERAIYVCPYCGLTELESHRNKIECKKCGRKVYYGETKELKGIGFEFPFKFVLDWYNYQKDFVNKLNIDDYINVPMYLDKASLSEVIVYKHKKKLYEGSHIILYGDRIVINAGEANEIIFPFEETSAVTVLGRNKLNIYHNKNIYQLKGGKRFNALKYVNIYHRYKNIRKGDEHGEFLGL